MRLENVKKEHWKQYKELYRSAFPRNERMPMPYLKYKTRKKQMEILELTEGGQFIGMVITAVYKSYVLLTYLAIREDARGEGYGSKALACIKKRYANRHLFLEIEELDPTAENYPERVRRKAFYMKNGLTPAEVHIRLAGIPMELMTWHCQMSEDKYLYFYRKTLGRVMGRMASKR